MNNKEFFYAVCELRRLQKRYNKYGDIDLQTKRQLNYIEELIDKEIKRVEAVLKEQAQPRLFSI